MRFTELYKISVLPPIQQTSLRAGGHGTRDGAGQREGDDADATREGATAPKGSATARPTRAAPPRRHSATGRDTARSREHRSAVELGKTQIL